MSDYNEDEHEDFEDEDEDEGDIILMLKLTNGDTVVCNLAEEDEHVLYVSHPILLDEVGGSYVPHQWFPFTLENSIVAVNKMNIVAHYHADETLADYYEDIIDNFMKGQDFEEMAH
jgi:Ni2+-binding GTPase involved in maturation of urease and hydrogenase